MKKVPARKKTKRNPVCVLFWRDAAYSYEKTLPKELPQIQATTGFIVVANDEYTNIATNVRFDAKTNMLSPVDGFVIPEKATIKFKKIGFLNK